jgi:hypothetical protein
MTYGTLAWMGYSLEFKDCDKANRLPRTHRNVTTVTAFFGPPTHAIVC